MDSTPKEIPLNNIELYASYSDIEFNNYAIEKGQQLQLLHRLQPSNATTDLSWKTYNPQVATVSNAGVITGIQTGKTDIELRDNISNIYCKFQITVVNDFSEPLDTINMYRLNSDSPIDSLSLELNKPIRFILNKNLQNNRPFIWRTNNDNVAIKTSTSNTYSGIITPKKIGSTVIEIYDTAGISKTINVNVTIPTKSSTTENEPNELQVYFKDYAMKIIGISEGKNRAQGTAFFFDNSNLVLTNYHVIQSCDSFEIQCNDSKNYKAYLVDYDKDIDVALLFVPDYKNYKYFSFKDELPQLNDSVYAVGFPRGKFNVTTGIVKKQEYDVRGYKYIATSAKLNAGNSGGPLINDSNKIIGLNLGRISDLYYLAIPASTVLEFIDSVDKTNLYKYVK